jgi:hypothetical protein
MGTEVKGCVALLRTRCWLRFCRFTGLRGVRFAPCPGEISPYRRQSHLENCSEFFLARGPPRRCCLHMHPIKDKRARLRVAARYIKTGVVKFPRKGCEQLLTQLLGFGAEKHDDAVDALVYLILSVIDDGIEERKVHMV